MASSNHRDPEQQLFALSMKYDRRKNLLSLLRRIVQSPFMALLCSFYTHFYQFNDRRLSEGPTKNKTSVAAAGLKIGDDRGNF